MINLLSEIPAAPDAPDAVVSQNESNRRCYLYSGLVWIALNNAPQGGLNVQQMRERVALQEALESIGEGEEFKLPATQLTKAREIYNAHPWGGVHKDIVAVGDGLNALCEG